MNKNQVLLLIKKVRDHSPKRNFPQMFDLLIKLKNLDLKKPEQKVDVFVSLPHSLGKKIKTCAFVDAQLETKAKESFNTVILKSDFAKYKGNVKSIRKLASSHSFFVAQAELMGQIATIFGKTLGSRGLMPNPKAGCVVPSSVLSLKSLVEKLEKTVHLQTKNELSIKAPFGLESLSDDQLADNLLVLYQTLLKSLSQEHNNVQSVSLKLTMGPLFTLNDEKNTNMEKK